MSTRRPASSSTTRTKPTSSPPLSPHTFYTAACRAHDAGDLTAAITLYSTAIDLDPRHVAALIGRGVARKESREYEAAIADYTRALQLSPNPATTLLILSNRANCLTAAASFAAALTDHNSALSLNKDDAVLWCNRGSTLMKLGRLDESLLDFQRALEVDQSYAVALYNSGLVHGRQGRIGECMKAFEKAAEIFKRTPANAVHAQDCERQMKYFGSSHAFNSTPRRTPHAIEINPLSPVHQRGITRSFPGMVPSATSSAQRSTEPSPAATPSSRAPLHDGLPSDALESPPEQFFMRPTIYASTPSHLMSQNGFIATPGSIRPQLDFSEAAGISPRGAVPMLQLSPLSDRSSHSDSPLSDEPLLISPTAKRPLTARKPSISTGEKSRQQAVRIHTKEKTPSPPTG
jgi:Tfp pilus assembly protein PilF